MYTVTWYVFPSLIVCFPESSLSQHIPWSPHLFSTNCIVRLQTTWHFSQTDMFNCSRRVLLILSPDLRNEIYTAGLWSKQRQINLVLDFAINTYNIFIVCKNFEVKKILWWQCTGLYRGYIFSKSLFTFYVGLMCRGWPLLQIIHKPTPRNIAHRFVFVSCASSDKVTSDY